MLIASNHISTLDPFLISASVYRLRFPRWLTKAELMRTPLLKQALAFWGCIPLDRGRPDIGAMRTALDVLARGGCVAIFPEGTRSFGGAPGRAKAGVGLLAREGGVPVIPVRVRNTESLFMRAPLKITFGRPMHYQGKHDRRACKLFAEYVLKAVFRL